MLQKVKELSKVLVGLKSYYKDVITLIDKGQFTTFDMENFIQTAWQDLNQNKSLNVTKLREKESILLEDEVNTLTPLELMTEIFEYMPSGVITRT